MGKYDTKEIKERFDGYIQNIREHLREFKKDPLPRGHLGGAIKSLQGACNEVAIMPLPEDYSYTQTAYKSLEKLQNQVYNAAIKRKSSPGNLNRLEKIGKRIKIDSDKTQKGDEDLTPPYPLEVTSFKSTFLIIGTISLIISLFFLSTNLTGNAIGSLPQNFSNGIGAVLFALGIIGVYAFFRKR